MQVQARPFSTFHSSCLIGMLIFWICLCAPRVPHAAAEGTGGNRIAAGDLLTITITAGGETQHASDVTVSAEGAIKVPLIGDLPAAGLTVRNLEAAIQALLARDYYVNPQVSVLIRASHSVSCYIWGAVHQPGLHQMPDGTRLLKLIAGAGGVTPDAGPVAYIIQNLPDAGAGTPKDLPSETPRVEVQLKQLLELGDTGHNPVVGPGDVVYIPLKETLSVAKGKIYIEGEVAKPGAYDFQEGMTALKACIAAGGFNNYSAANRARIIRGEGSGVQVIKVNLLRIQSGQQADVPLMPGDRIHIPESWI